MRSWLKDCSTRTMSPTEAAWLAGFFDGEGSLSSYRAGRNKQSIAWKLAVSNTSRPALDRCVAYTEVGSITDSNKRNRPEHHKPQWEWHVYRQRDIISVLEQILPFLVIKKQKADEFISNWIDLKHELGMSEPKAQ